MAEKKLRFKGKIQGKVAGVVAAITPPVRGRVPVRGTMNGFPFRSSLTPCGTPPLMPVNQALGLAAGAKPGDVVEVVMEPRPGATRPTLPPN